MAVLPRHARRHSSSVMQVNSRSVGEERSQSLGVGWVHF